MKKPLKLCVISTVHPPFDDRIFYKEICTLVKAGYKVNFIVQHEKNEIVDGVNIIAIPKSTNRFSRIFVLSFKTFHIARKLKADIYHFHDPEFLPWAALLNIITGARIIYDLHENVKKQILNKTWLPFWLRRILSILYILIEKVCFPFISHLIIAEDSYKENYPNVDNVILVRNYPVLAYLETSDGSCLDYQKKDPNVFYVTYVGGVTELRGAIELINSIRQIKHTNNYKVILNLIGPISPLGLAHRLKVMVADYKIENEVKITGGIPHKDVFGILAQSDIGIAVLHPDLNYIESLPVKLFEYMAAGLPVIASNFSLWKEVVEGCQSGLVVDPLDTKAITKAIIHLLDNPDIRIRMGQNGKQAVREKYHWDIESQKLLELYNFLSSKE